MLRSAYMTSACRPTTVSTVSAVPAVSMSRYPAAASEKMPTGASSSDAVWTSALVPSGRSTDVPFCGKGRQLVK